MSAPGKPRVPIKAGLFTIPDDPTAPPKFLATRCDDCGEFFFPRRQVCGKCLSERTAPVELDGRGTLYSYTFVHLPLFGSTNLAHMDGYGVGQVDLPEGPRIQAPLAGRREELRVGMKVQAELDTLREDAGRDIVIFRFRPVEEQA